MKYVRKGQIVEGCSVGGIVAFLLEDLDKATAEPLIIEVTPKAGDYLNGASFEGKSKIMLKDVMLKWCTLNETCPPSRNGKIGIEVSGIVRNEYERGYYICLHAIAYDSKGNVAGRSVDYGPVCGSNVLYLKSGEEKEFELHLELKENISMINNSDRMLEWNSSALRYMLWSKKNWKSNAYLS